MRGVGSSGQRPESSIPKRLRTVRRERRLDLLAGLGLTLLLVAGLVAVTWGTRAYRGRLEYQPLLWVPAVLLAHVNLHRPRGWLRRSIWWLAVLWLVAAQPPVWRSYNGTWLGAAIEPLWLTLYLIPGPRPSGRPILSGLMMTLTALPMAGFVVAGGWVMTAAGWLVAVLAGRRGPFLVVFLAVALLSAATGILASLPRDQVPVLLAVLAAGLLCLGPALQATRAQHRRLREAARRARGEPRPAGRA